MGKAKKGPRFKAEVVKKTQYLGPLTQLESVATGLPSPHEVARRLSDPATVAWMTRLALEAGHCCPSPLEAALEAMLGFQGVNPELEQHWRAVASILADPSNQGHSGARSDNTRSDNTTAATTSMVAREVHFYER